MDYYQVLGLTNSATSTEIRAAYKRLAMQYHPDRNPNNPQAEEMFKVVNEAYHILSDPLKKSRYDARMHSVDTYQTDEYWRKVQRERYARWKQAQQRPRYVFDKEYFRVQGLALLVFIVIAGFCFALIRTGNYFYQKKLAQIHAENLKKIASVDSLYNLGKIEDAFAMLKFLREQQPAEYQFLYARDSLVAVLRSSAKTLFTTQQFSKSLYQLKILKEQEFPPRMETLERIAYCYYQLGDYPEAVATFKQIQVLRPWDVTLTYQIGIIYQSYLNNADEALHYFTLAKSQFKSSMSSIYGEAFEVVMIPADVPDVYNEVFRARAKLNMELKNYTEVITDCNWAIFLRPGQGDMYKLRALAKIETNYTNRLCEDLNAARQLGENVTNTLLKKHCL